MATLPGVWQYRARAGSCWPGVSILWPGRVESLSLSQCGSTYICLNRSVPEIHSHVAGTLSNQQTITRLGHECQDLFESIRWNACVHRLDVRLYSHATSISVWQRVQSSEQIRPWDRLACFSDVKQPTTDSTVGWYCGQWGHSFWSGLPVCPPPGQSP